MQAPALGWPVHAPGTHEIEQDGEAERTAECAGENRQSHGPVVDMQTGAVRRETGVVICHDGEEQRFPQCVTDIAMVDFVQAGEQCDERDAFDDECGGDDHGEYALDFAEFRGAEFVGGEQSLRSLEMMVHRQCDERGEGHDAQAAHLHREDQHRLAEGGPMRSGVDDGDAAGGDCGNGGEKCGGEVGGIAPWRGDRSQEQTGGDCHQ